ncbi:MAG: hypothetical protein KatS3mg076_0372 [Candidatus Binatia bacterium]|nr:MAG: hypothetical protein KatS3mg076_0372 [Candidatus Binatia bacterium]
MSLEAKRFVIAVLSLFFLLALLLVAYRETLKHRAEEEPPPVVTAANEACVTCHAKHSAALVLQWKASAHARVGVGCLECHAAEERDVDAWRHEGVWVSALVTPLDCGRCHAKEHEEFRRSHHARAGEILASLDNVLAEKVEGSPGNRAAAVNGCMQCHGSIVRFVRTASGDVQRVGPEQKPLVDPETWPNSGMGRINPDGSKGSCHACHSRHEFQAKLSRSPENCGKCHMGPDHPQIEIYNESKHGIAFYANRHRMALDKDGDWVLGRDYFSAPTCATCHISSYVSPTGEVKGNTHDVGERISWTLRPVVSTKINLVKFEDGYQEDYPETRPLPKEGETVETVELVRRGDELVRRTVPRRVSRVITWRERREAMKGVCLNCHNHTYVDHFYQQFDSLVSLYNEKFARPAKALVDGLYAEGFLDPRVPFAEKVEWTFFELWHHEGRRARHGASMMGPDFTQWHGMYEVAKHFYTKFLPEVVELAERHGKGDTWRARVEELLSGEDHAWLRGLRTEEAEALRRAYRERYDEKTVP